MTLKLLETACLGGNSIALSSLVTLTAAANPTYLVVDALDRDEYTAAATGATGSFAGDGNALGLASIGGDARGAGIVFTWQASTGQYVNATYGSLGQLDFIPSTSAGDITNLSFFGTSNAALALNDANNAYALMQADAGGYLGSATLDTTGAAPTAATPDGVAEAALALVGQAWNQDGCWVLASTIAADAGAGLPVQSTEVGRPGAANGEWIVLYNGPSGANANWKNLVSTGDMVVFATSATTGHITTCVSGAGSTAMLVDNITYIGQGGAIVNSADDGASADVTIAPPHPAAQEFAGVNPGSVVIYALDTPAVTDKLASATLTTGSTVGLATLFAASDPGHKSITAWQVYDSGGTDTLLLNGQATAAGTTLTAASLSQLSLSAGGTPTADTIDIRASNGTYWGDWQSLNVDIIAAPPKPPVATTRIASQTWQQGTHILFALPATLFRDPQGSALTYSASLPGGGALPAWLSFDPAADAFSGTVPAGVEKFSLVVTATDALGASAATSFAVNVPAAAPMLLNPEPAQNVAAGSIFSFALPAGSFADPQGEHLAVKASLPNGAALPGWLTFSAATGTFSGTAPKTPSTLEIKMTATDSSALSTTETFALSIGDFPTAAGAAAEQLPHVADAAYALKPELVVTVGFEGWWPTVHIG